MDEFELQMNLEMNWRLMAMYDAEPKVTWNFDLNYQAL